jgi:hypothetical protein
VRGGGIPPLIELLTSGTNGQKEHAAGLLRYLAANNANNKIAIARDGGILPLIALVTSGTDGQK